MINILLMIVALMLLLYIVWFFLWQILFTIIMSVTYFITVGLIYERTIGHEYSDSKKICLNIFNVLLKFPSDLVIINENSQYKFKKNDIEHFLYIYTSPLICIFILTTTIIAPNIISVYFFVKAIVMGLLLAGGTFIAIKAYSEQLDKVKYY